MLTNLVEWLLIGDPAIRWQVMQDLLSLSPELVYDERKKVGTTGWGLELLSHQGNDGQWGKGIYNPKWTSTTYTLLLLRQLGLLPGNSQALLGCEQFYFCGFEADGGINLFKNINYSEICINGMILCLLSYFQHPDERIHRIADFLLHEQMPDGGWNCQKNKGATHSSFNTTISVLEGFLEYRQSFPDISEKIDLATSRAHEFLLQHHLYQSHRSGRPAKPEMTRMYFPPRWHFDFIRGLDYFQSFQAYRDPRMQAAIDLLLKKQTDTGQWTLNKIWAGQTYFQMEQTGSPSRWNTLRALRVLKWWNAN